MKRKLYFLRAKTIASIFVSLLILMFLWWVLLNLPLKDFPLTWQENVSAIIVIISASAFLITSGLLVLDWIFEE